MDMMDGLMKSVFKFAGFTPAQAKDMIEGTFKVVQTIGADMAEIKADVKELKNGQVNDKANNE